MCTLSRTQSLDPYPPLACKPPQACGKCMHSIQSRKADNGFNNTSGDRKLGCTYIARSSSSFLPLFLPPRKPLTMTAGMVSPAAHHACTMV